MFLPVWTWSVSSPHMRACERIAFPTQGLGGSNSSFFCFVRWGLADFAMSANNQFREL